MSGKVIKETIIQTKAEISTLNRDISWRTEMVEKDKAKVKVLQMIIKQLENT